MSPKICYLSYVLTTATVLALLVILNYGLRADNRTAQTASAPAQIVGDHTAFLPVLNSTVQVDAATCPLNSQEQGVADFMTQDAGQQRTTLTCNPTLAQVARERAEDMATRNYFSHTTPEGFGPNYIVSQAGYIFPSLYPTTGTANTIESIGAGYSTSTAVWQQWVASDSHRTHLLGLSDFYKAQTEYGIGYASDPGSSFTHYWVVIIAQPGP